MTVTAEPLLEPDAELEYDDPLAAELADGDDMHVVIADLRWHSLTPEQQAAAHAAAAERRRIWDSLTPKQQVEVKVILLKYWSDQSAAIDDWSGGDVEREGERLDAAEREFELGVLRRAVASRPGPTAFARPLIGVRVAPRRRGSRARRVTPARPDDDPDPPLAALDDAGRGGA